MHNRIAINMIQSYSCSTQTPNNIYFRFNTNPEGKGSVRWWSYQALESFPTHIVTSPSTSLCLFCNSYFELLIIETEPVSNTQGLLWTLVKYTSITCISYILLFTLPSFLSAKYLGAVPLPVTISFAVEALSFRLGSSFWLLHGSGNLLVILLEVPFLSLAILLETSGLFNHQHLMLFLISTFVDFSITKSSGIAFAIPCIL